MSSFIPKDKRVILFDGNCNLCNGFINKVIHYDKRDSFVFASLKSDIGKKICDYLKIDTDKTDSIVLYQPGISYDIKSTAALKIMNQFGGLWKISQIFWVFPQPVRDYIYDLIAKNRHRWFGKTESCLIATTELKSKFLDDIEAV